MTLVLYSLRTFNNFIYYNVQTLMILCNLKIFIMEIGGIERFELSSFRQVENFARPLQRISGRIIREALFILWHAWFFRPFEFAQKQAGIFPLPFHVTLMAIRRKKLQKLRIDGKSQADGFVAMPDSQVKFMPVIIDNSQVVISACIISIERNHFLIG